MGGRKNPKDGQNMGRVSFAMKRWLKMKRNQFDVLGYCLLVFGLQAHMEVWTSSPIDREPQQRIGSTRMWHWNNTDNTKKGVQEFMSQSSLLLVPPPFPPPVPPPVLLPLQLLCQQEKRSAVLLDTTA